MNDCDNNQECEKIVPGEITPEPLPIPGGGGGTSDFNQLTNLPKYGGVTMSGATDIPNNEAIIPAAASSQNQLADKSFVNSSVATNTANFVGTFSTIEELEAVQNPTNNDYGFVIAQDASGNTVYNRYKYRANDSTWAFEYALNNSSFTSDQWAAIQSGITSGDVSKLQGLANIQGLGNEFSLDEDNILHLAEGLINKGLPTLDAKDFENDRIQVEDVDPGVYKITYTGSGTYGMVYNGTAKLLGYVTKDQEAILVVADDRYNSPHKIALAFSDEAGNNFPTKWLWVNSYNQTSTSGRTQVVFDSSGSSIQLGKSSSAATAGVAVGGYAEARDAYSTAVGGGNSTSAGRRAYASNQSVAIGAAFANGYMSIAIGTGAKATTQGEVNMGTGDYSATGGYNGTPYRLIRGIHPGEQDHDVAVVGQMNARILAGGTTAPTTSTAGEVSSLYAYVENTTGHLAICTEVDTTDPDNPVYTWQTLV